MKDEHDGLHPLLAGMGQRLKERREQLELSQRAVAEVAGTDAARVSRLERGLRVSNLSINIVAGLAHALGCRFAWLACGDGPVEAPPGIDSPYVVAIISTGGTTLDHAAQLDRIKAALQRGETPPAQLPASVHVEDEPPAPVRKKTRRRRTR